MEEDFDGFEEEEFEEDEEDEDFVDSGNSIKKKKANKVEIVIEDKDENGTPFRFSPTTYGGAKYISVNYGMGSNSKVNYGGGSPCIDEEAVKRAVEHAKETILSEGDIPIVIDKRVKMDLMSFFGEAKDESDKKIIGENPTTI